MNKGLRIDYVLASSDMCKRLKSTLSNEPEAESGSRRRTSSLHPGQLYPRRGRSRGRPRGRRLPDRVACVTTSSARERAMIKAPFPLGITLRVTEGASGFDVGSVVVSFVWG